MAFLCGIMMAHLPNKPMVLTLKYLYALSNYVMTPSEEAKTLILYYAILGSLIKLSLKNKKNLFISHTPIIQEQELNIFLINLKLLMKTHGMVLNKNSFLLPEKGHTPLEPL